ncbi:hypothetical protein NB311A_13241 [Nitrobacter sp. Nb-311A]|uniref:hypothetical protein n=1 Tax=Nitrobacter sp. Nb-311A TaxID=314253 RepID=UPI00006849C9|nr:hypothetical protein [Nitrobacter sp. Nb-311A]EAQ35283.1 hypothetical protein NB311A_13241 [Nitrobacter sp. Nb-311A]
MSDFLDNLKEAVGANPLSATLIGGGALWLLLGNERLRSAAASVSAATARPRADTRTNLRSSAPEFANSPQTAREMDQGAVHGVHTLSEISSAASGAANTIKDRLGEGATYARESFSKAAEVLPPKETIAKVQSSISNLIERQPLVLGAIGLAVGVAVASAFTASDLENEWIGEVSDRVKEDLEARAGSVSHSVREASDTLKATFRDIGSEAADRLKETGRNVLDAAREKASA